jgi:hypothetical protein
LLADLLGAAALVNLTKAVAAVLAVQEQRLELF